MKRHCRIQASAGAAPWLTDKYIYVMLTLYPLFVGFHGYTRLTASKFVFFAAATSLWLIALIFVQLIPSKRSPMRRLGLFQWLIIIYAALCIVSALLSDRGQYVLMGAGRYDGLLTELLLVSIFLGISQFAVMKRGYIYALALSASICCIIGILQLWGVDFLKLFPSGFTYYDGGIKYSGEFFGTIGNVDPFSEFLCLALPLFSVYYITAKNRCFLLLFPASLCCFCLFVSSVSGGKLALLACVLISTPFVLKSSGRLLRALELFFVLCIPLALSLAFHGEQSQGIINAGFCFGTPSLVILICSAVLLFLHLALSKKRFSPRRLSVFFAVSSGLIVTIGLVAVFFFGTAAGGTMGELSQLLHGNVDDSFGSSRILIWRRALELFRETPLLGGGPGTFSLRADIHFSRFVEETGKTLTSSVDNAHNIYLGMLVNTGVVSLLFFLGAAFASLVRAAKSRFSPTAFALGCSLFCYWIQGFFALGLFLVSPLAWIIWGLLAVELRGKIE